MGAGCFTDSHLNLTAATSRTYFTHGWWDCGPVAGGDSNSGRLAAATWWSLRVWALCAVPHFLPGDFRLTMEGKEHWWVRVLRAPYRKNTANISVISSICGHFTWIPSWKSFREHGEGLLAQHALLFSLILYLFTLWGNVHEHSRS